MAWTRYTIVNERSFRALLGEEAPFPSDAELTEAGFDPADEELASAFLASEWNGHPAGSRVLFGLVVTGHPFAVEVTE